ncbi:hypothetical protein IPH70_00480 [Candidatus Roizmanbacteria bacterium]|nr:MAG: hypothetical protein IPH70_00480 [Candidatus Roizmanbacteria bacterium]
MDLTLRSLPQGLLPSQEDLVLVQPLQPFHLMLLVQVYSPRTLQSLVLSAGSLTVGGDTITDFKVQDLVQLVTHLSPHLVPQSQTELDNSTITFAGDLGSSTTALGATRTISGGTNGIDTSDNNAGTLTINFDSTEVGTTTFGSGSALPGPLTQLLEPIPQLPLDLTLRSLPQVLLHSQEDLVLVQLLLPFHLMLLELESSQLTLPLTGTQPLR